ncbi:hypothetical protein HDU67_008934 [Dinochytrium kinnereticum]|nr:hypothetical protein HDU67_008934 [Dinochytrium kinnereticum]
MLGGFGALTDIDCKSSIAFLKPYVVKSPMSGMANYILSDGVACDCGAGIGRVSKHFLLKLIKCVDLVEQNHLFLEEAKNSYMGDEEMRSRVLKFLPIGLQDFNPEKGRYEIIWCQWVLGHLTDRDFVSFFRRCSEGIAEHGFIGVKENMSQREIEVDTTDSSVTRTEEHLKNLFSEAGLEIVKEELQLGFPKGLYKVKMFLLRPFKASKA